MSQKVDIETLICNDIDARISFGTEFGQTATAELTHEILQQRLDSDILILYQEELDRRLAVEIEISQLREAEEINKEKREELNSSTTEPRVSDEYCKFIPALYAFKDANKQLTAYADASSAEEWATESDSEWDSDSGDESQSSKPGFNDILSAFGEVQKDTLATRVEEWRRQVAQEQSLDINKVEQDIPAQIADIRQLKKQREEKEANATERDYDGDLSSNDDDGTISSSSSSSSASC